MTDFVDAANYLRLAEQSQDTIFHRRALTRGAEEIEKLQSRVEQADQENERVRQANLDVMMHFEDMKAEKEKAEALAESEIMGFMSVAVEICRQEADEWDSDRLQTFKNYAEVCAQRIEKLMPGYAKAHIVQQQADALIDASNAMGDGFDLPSDNYAEEQAVIRCQQFVCEQAQKLYAQAAAIEGGEA